MEEVGVLECQSSHSNEYIIRLVSEIDAIFKGIEVLLTRRKMLRVANHPLRDYLCELARLDAADMRSSAV